MKNPVIEELKVLRDELKLQAHLFSMEAKDEFAALEKKLESFAKEVEAPAQRLGQINEELWIGRHMELKNLKEEYENLKSSYIAGH